MPPDTPVPTTRESAAPPVLTEEQREQLRAWHESLGCRCIASIETVPCCIDYLLDGLGE